MTHAQIEAETREQIEMFARSNKIAHVGVSKKALRCKIDTRLNASENVAQQKRSTRVYYSYEGVSIS